MRVDRDGAAAAVDREGLPHARRSKPSRGAGVIRAGSSQRNGFGGFRSARGGECSAGVLSELDDRDTRLRNRRACRRAQDGKGHVVTPG